jgi:hypothetical protein
MACKYGCRDNVAVIENVAVGAALAAKFLFDLKNIAAKAAPTATFFPKPIQYKQQKSIYE